jgi:hypothetical protein
LCRAGLEKLLSLDWQRPTRVVIHIADAPCHGREFHDVADTYPDDGKRIKPLLERLSGMSVDFFFGAMNSRTDKMLAQMNQLMGCEYVHRVDVKSAGAGAGAVGESIRVAVTKSVSMSLSMRRSVASRTLGAGAAASSSAAAVPKPYLVYAPLTPTPAAFSRLPKQKMTVYINTGIENVDQLRLVTESEPLLTFSKATPVGGDADTQRCQIQKDPFSKGASRFAYHVLVRARVPQAATACVTCPKHR